MNIWTIVITMLIASCVAAVAGYALEGWGILALAGIILFFYFRVTIFKFVGEVKVELDKCAWPWDPNQTGFKKFRELRDSTVVVILSVILLAGFVTTSDWLLTHLVGFLTGTRIATAGALPTPPVH